MIDAVGLAWRRLDVLGVRKIRTAQIVLDNQGFVQRVVQICGELFGLVPHSLRQRGRKLEVVVRDETVVFGVCSSQVVIGGDGHHRYNAILRVLRQAVFELPSHQIRGDLSFALELYRLDVATIVFGQLQQDKVFG